MGFEDAVNKGPAPIRGKSQPGTQALSRDHAKQVGCSRRRAFTASLELDEALKREPVHARANRWDYGIGYNTPANGGEVAIWVEVHSAYTGEVSVVLKKLQWLKDYLAGECDDLWRMTQAGNDPYHWIAPGKFAILKNSPQARELSKSGLSFPKSKLTLP